MSLTANRQAFAVPLMHFEVVMENVIPIRIKHRDKNTVAVQQAHISLIIIDMRPFCRRLIWHVKDFRVLYGYI